MIEFYDNDMSSCAQKVRLVLYEKDLPFERHYLDLRAGDQFDPEYLKLNPNAVVPTIVDKGEPVIESTVIVEYLDEAYPTAPLSPRDPLQRAHMRQWMIRPDAGLHDAVGVTSYALAFRHQHRHLDADALNAFLEKIPNERRRNNVGAMITQGADAPGVGEALRLYHKTVTDMGGRLQSTDWLAGDAYSLAEVAILPYIIRLDHLGLGWFWDDKPAVADWYSRATQRSNYRAISDYLDTGYLELMQSLANENRKRARELLSSA